MLSIHTTEDTKSGEIQGVRCMTKRDSPLMGPMLYNVIMSVTIKVFHSLLFRALLGLGGELLPTR